jgi:hypothetical protein
MPLRFDVFLKFTERIFRYHIIQNTAPNKRLNICPRRPLTQSVTFGYLCRVLAVLQNSAIASAVNMQISISAAMNFWSVLCGRSGISSLSFPALTCNFNNSYVAVLLIFRKFAISFLDLGI